MYDKIRLEKGVNMNTHEKFMREAIKEAKKAYEKDEVPVGAVIVKDGKIISQAHNLRDSKQIVTKHAEIIAIEKANKKYKNTTNGTFYNCFKKE